MSLMGYTNRVAWVDVTAGRVDYRPIAEEDALKYASMLRGLGVKYGLRQRPAGRPLSPDNILFAMNGPLTGTDANTGGRLAVVTKSPLTGTVADAHHGGWSAAAVWWAGFDGLVFKGQVCHPGPLSAEDGQVTLHAMPVTCGARACVTTLKAALQERYCEPKSLRRHGHRPGPVSLVRFGCWLNENDRASGRNALPAPWAGSKHLKAHCASATRRISQDQPARTRVLEKAR
ncbi:aldehyde ferredoxin oxidoreductase N-terminal domain-containing protein [Candidatus Amarolinea dominans]|uniref:aldehyde ferredoxin oxidoreductase N-terminal domain-containing protein n=1 Tax=Candidatus Amarolinea dominans TaxID=3140696 RepID=UPI0031CCBAC9